MIVTGSIMIAVSSILIVVSIGLCLSMRMKADSANNTNSGGLVLSVSNQHLFFRYRLLSIVSRNRFSEAILTRPKTTEYTTSEIEPASHLPIISFSVLAVRQLLRLSSSLQH